MFQVVLAAYEQRFSHTCRRAECWAYCRLFLQGGVPGAWVPLYPQHVFFSLSLSIAIIFFFLCSLDGLCTDIRLSISFIQCEVKLTT